MKLTSKVLELLKENTRAKTLIALAMGKSVHTVEGWIANNNDNLTKAECLQIIKVELELADDKILESEAAA